MSKVQTRKQRILKDVQKNRRQRTILSFVVVIALISIIVTAAAFIPRTNFPFPCLGSEPTTLHVHPYLQIKISGQSVTIPAYVGITTTYLGGQCFEPLHTHDASGIIHVEAGDVNSQYTLGDFFKIWANTYGSVQLSDGAHPIVFNNTDILGFTAGSGNRVTLIVDGTNSTSRDYASLVLKMYDYCTAAKGSVPPCSPTAGGDPNYNGQAYPYGTGHTLVINYGP